MARPVLVPASLADRPLRVGVLVDLPWSPTAGGHVKTWERLARAALSSPETLELTIHFQGATPSRHILGSNVRYEIHAPVFSTARLSFLSHIPAHTDLARHHRRLAARLVIDGASDGLIRNRYDVLHTTDGAFNFARTAARAAAARQLPLVTSVHTDTARYTRIFTAAAIPSASSGRVWCRACSSTGWGWRASPRGACDAASTLISDGARSCCSRAATTGRGWPACSARTVSGICAVESSTAFSIRPGATACGWRRAWAFRAIAAW